MPKVMDELNEEYVRTIISLNGNNEQKIKQIGTIQSPF